MQEQTIIPNTSIIIPNFRVWATVKLGVSGLTTIRLILARLNGSGFRIGDSVNYIFGMAGLPVATASAEIDIVIPSVGELGFAEGATVENIYRQAGEFSLGICPADVGAHLLLQHTDRVRDLVRQLNGHPLVVGMEAVKGQDGTDRLFYIEKEIEVLCIYGHYDVPSLIWKPDDRFIFSCPRGQTK